MIRGATPVAIEARGLPHGFAMVLGRSVARKVTSLVVSSLLGLACGGGADSAQGGAEGGGPNLAGADTFGPDLAGGSSGGDDQAAPPGGVCEVLEVPSSRVPPDLLVLVDRSGSMAGERWTVATQSVGGAVEQLGSQARFGLALYPSIGEELACTGGRVTVEPSERSAPTVASSLREPAAVAQKDNGYTPTRATLESVRAWHASHPSGGRPRYVVLVTDGKPNCPTQGEKYFGDELATYAALDALRTDGVRTFVVGYLTQDVASVMDKMAEHGGTGRHYPVAAAADLTAALSSITQTATTCTFRLSKPPRSAAYIRVSLAGTKVEADPVNGWALDEPTVLSLRGKACESLQRGTGPVKVTVACEPEAPK